MGWSIYIESNKPILEEEVDRIVEILPEELRGPWESMGYKNKKSNEGWQTACDIYPPEKETLRIGGSYGMSGHIAEKMAEYLKDELEKNGHIINLKPNW